MKRPVTVSVLGWVAVVWGGLGLFTPLFALNEAAWAKMEAQSSLSVQIQLTWAFLGAMVVLTNGVFLLRGRNWARIVLPLYLWTSFAAGLVYFQPTPAGALV